MRRGPHRISLRLGLVILPTLLRFDQGDSIFSWGTSNVEACLLSEARCPGFPPAGSWGDGNFNAPFNCLHTSEGYLEDTSGNWLAFLIRVPAIEENRFN